jgi:hypothetical protein
MCVIKIHAFTSIGRPPSWSGTRIAYRMRAAYDLSKFSPNSPFNAETALSLSDVLLICRRLCSLERTYQSVVTYMYLVRVYVQIWARYFRENICIPDSAKAALSVRGLLNVEGRTFYAQICNYETSVGQDMRSGDMSSGLVCCLIRDTL